MSLGFRFAPIDVDLPDHPRVKRVEKRLRRAALGLYVAAYCYAQKHSPGVVPHAFVEDDDPKVVAELVRVGLWLEADDGWRIFNWEKKSPGRKTSTDRVKRFRETRKSVSETPDETPSETLHETPPTARGETSASPSLSTSVSLSVSQGDPRGAPEWVDEAIASVTMVTGETFDRGIVWAKYQGGRERDARDVGPADFRSFLASWAAKQKSDRIRAPASPRRPERQPLGNVAELPWVASGGGDL